MIIYYVVIKFLKCTLPFFYNNKYFIEWKRLVSNEQRCLKKKFLDKNIKRIVKNNERTNLDFKHLVFKSSIYFEYS